MTPTFVIVPVRNEWELTRKLIWLMTVDACDDLLILDNGSEDGTPRFVRAMRRGGPLPNPRTGETIHFAYSKLHLSMQPGKTISEMWNAGFARAKRLAKGQPFNVLIANNDIELPLFAVEYLARALRSDASVTCSYPDYDAEWSGCIGDRELELPTRETRGVFGDGGMFGPCFMLRGEAIYWEPLITDLAYGHWWQDNHLAECIEMAGGRQVRVVGLPILHVNEATARHYPELYNVKLQDRGKWITRHQRGFGVAP